MKIAVIGYGQMGRIIEGIALGRGHKVVTVDPRVAEAEFQSISEESLQGVEAAIDFTHPSCALENIEKTVGLGVNLVVGTTGWYEKLEEVQARVKKQGTGFLYATNFSVGVNVFYEVLKNTCQIMNNIESYDVAGLEFHHNRKADSPSGTAQSMAEIILENMDRKKAVDYDKVDRKIEEDTLHFSSVRCGSIPGTHEVVFDSDADTISLKHTARNRSGFALGSVLAAEWLKDKNGFFTISDFVKSILK